MTPNERAKCIMRDMGERQQRDNIDAEELFADNFAILYQIN